MKLGLLISLTILAFTFSAHSITVSTVNNIATTSGAHKKSELSKFIVEIEQAGGSGRLLSGRNLFAAGDSCSVYRLQQLPGKAIKTSGISWLRLPDTHDLINDLLKSGVPILIAEFPENFAVSAWTIPGSDSFANDILKTGNLSHSKSIILIRADSEKSHIQHEYQHWIDTQNNLHNALALELRTLPGNVPLFQTAIVEIRGYAAQEAALLADQVLALPVAFGGKILTGTAAKDYRENEIAETQEKYIQTYLEKLNGHLIRLRQKDPRSAKQFISILKKYELHTKGKISFSYLLNL
jgi:hypothetical protein